MLEECLCPPSEIAMAGTCAECPDREQPPAGGHGDLVNGRGERPGIPRHRQLEVIRHLAAGDITRAEVARRFGVHRSAITMFAKRHRTEIEQVRKQLDDDYAGLWIADQRNRLGAYQADYELAAEHPNAAHHEWLKARTGILHAVAEETGALKGGVVIIPVQHLLVGVDPEDLK